MSGRYEKVPAEWLLLDGDDADWEGAIGLLPPGSGVLFLTHRLEKKERQRLIARIGVACRKAGLTLVVESEIRPRRVHNSAEMRRALGQGEGPLFLSPLFATRSHPEWAPLPRMRASTLARLARWPVIALGGVTRERFRQVRKLGFSGWAGIRAWRS